MKKQSKPAPVVVQKTLNASAEKVWQALTDRDQMAIWYFDLKEFRPVVGFEFEFTGGAETGRQYVHHCRITEAEPLKKLTYSWRYEGYTGESFVTFLLTEMGEKTRLQVTHRGLETFPASEPDFAAGNFWAGWRHILHTGLAGFLKKAAS